MVANPYSANVARALERVAAAASRAGRDLDTDPVELLAATKYVGADEIRLLVEAGIGLIGENRLDALVDKQQALPGLDVRWDFIGRLQSRKAAHVAPRVSRIHSLASQSAARRLADWVRADAQAALPELLVQVNIAGEEAKEGVAPGELSAFLDGLPEQIVVHGLMTMPPLASSPEDNRRWFSSLRELRDEAARGFTGRHALRQLSMGTSQDYDVAVEEGATVVRLGHVLYDA